jgi:transcriptional regulator with XRE-family HTH domain
MDATINTLQERLRAARTGKGLAVSQVSIASGVPEQTIRQWESGRRRNPSVLLLAKVAKVLDVPLEHLTGAQ